MKLRLFIISLTLTFLFAGSSFAQLGGKNVILVHGFNPQQLLFPPSDGGKVDGPAYWTLVDPALRAADGAYNVIYWPSNKRLTGKDGVISVVKPQIEKLVADGYCTNQCVIVTHSTGDLVTRFLLKNRRSILGSDLADQFKVAAVVDLAGAGGGTELANIGVSIADGVNYAADILSALLEYAGFSIHVGLNVGIMRDLQTTVARNHATNGFPAIPHLRIVGGGSEIFGFATKPLIPGGDDSVVGLHSACGAAMARGYDSCSNDTRIDGRVMRVSNAPKQSELYDFHYPIVMGEKLPHNALKSDARGYTLTTVRSAESQYQNRDSAGMAIDIDDYEKREWWDWWRTYRYIRDASERSVTEVLVSSVAVK